MFGLGLLGLGLGSFGVIGRACAPNIVLLIVSVCMHCARLITFQMALFTVHVLCTEYSVSQCILFIRCACATKNTTL